jgi:hypothetical protein
MQDALVVYSLVAAMRHAGYLSFAAAVLGLVEAHRPGLRSAVLRVRAWLVNGCGAAMRRSTAVPRRHEALTKCVEPRGQAVTRKVRKIFDTLSD